MLISQILGALLAIKRSTWRFAFSIKVFHGFSFDREDTCPRYVVDLAFELLRRSALLSKIHHSSISVLFCLIFCLFVFVPLGDGKVPGPWLQRRTRVSSLSWKKARKAEERLVRMSERHQKNGGPSLSENKRSHSAWTVVYIYRNQMATLFNSVQLFQFSMRTAI